MMFVIPEVMVAEMLLSQAILRSSIELWIRKTIPPPMPILSRSCDAVIGPAYVASNVSRTGKSAVG